ncbi:MAG: ribonucleotide-diphosphate reductase subunit alpha, partial [bacterium]
YDHIREVVRLGVRFLDNIVDLNKFPINQIREMTQGNRRIGLGVMGFADMLYALRIPYDSEEAIELARELMKFIHTEARQMSDELAVERGPFPNWKGSVFDHPTRNSTVTTIAPTGTISMIADTSGGIEPNFALCYVKRVMDDDRLLYVNQRLKEISVEEGWYSESLMEQIARGASIKNFSAVPAWARRVFVTAHDITPEWHVRMQAAFQEWTDNAVSKTINFPHNATVEDVKNAYMLAWKLKCKGITIYRDGSRSVQVMNVGDKLAKEQERADSEVFPSEVSLPRPVTPERFPPGRLQPRNRPRITRGYTEQIRTGEGTLYVTINEDEYGLCEVFASIGKVGGSAMAHAEAIGRLISLALRSGIDPHVIVTQLKGITGPNPIWFDNRLIRSVPDAIAQALERYLDQKESRQQALPLEIKETIPPQLQEFLRSPAYDNGNGDQGGIVAETCPDCNSPLSFAEGCLTCRFCGYSKCD